MGFPDIHLHPALVHFPVALFVSAFLLEAASFLFEKESFHRSAIHFYVLAGILAPLAVWTRILVTLAAYNGGRLVYEYGIGVEL